MSEMAIDIVFEFVVKGGGICRGRHHSRQSEGHRGYVRSWR